MATAEVCYICHEEATERDQFIDPNPCICKGSIKLHNSCLEELLRTTYRCGICRTTFRNNDIITARTFWPNGLLFREATFLNRKIHGPVKIYDETGQLRAEWNYINDKLSGPYKLYHKDGTVEIEGIN